ncbi:MAG: AIR synthase-related protein, partial [Cyanobacteria bacterium J06650_10]
GMVGLISDLSKVCGQGWQSAGDLIYLLGVATDDVADGALTLGGSEYLKTIHKTVAGQPPKVNLDLELAVQAACRHGIRSSWIRSAHDCSEGGLAIALAEACISGQKGANITLTQGSLRTDTVLFGEGGARILVSVSSEAQSDWEQYCQHHLADCSHLIGQVTETPQTLVIKTEQKTLINAEISNLKQQWSQAIEKALVKDS